MPGLAPPVLTAESVPPPVSAPVPVPASSEPIETAVTASAAPTPVLTRSCSRQHLCRFLPRFRCQYRLPRSRPRLRSPRPLHLRPFLACGARGSICAAIWLGSGVHTGFIGLQEDPFGHCRATHTVERASAIWRIGRTSIGHCNRYGRPCHAAQSNRRPSSGINRRPRPHRLP